MQYSKRVKDENEWIDLELTMHDIANLFKYGFIVNTQPVWRVVKVRLTTKGFVDIEP